MLIRGAGRGQEVLLGRRRETARFMPGYSVFPGGVLEPEDRQASGYPEQPLSVPLGIDGATRRALPRFARAALRETYEETGLLVGRSTSHVAPTQRCDFWQAYAERRLAPAFDALALFAIAVTPTSYPIRFHARFFLADGALAQGVPESRDELEQVAWVPLGRLQALRLPSVTRRVLQWALVQRRLAPRRWRAWHSA